MVEMIIRARELENTMEKKKVGRNEHETYILNDEHYEPHILLWYIGDN